MYVEEFWMLLFAMLGGNCQVKDTVKQLDHYIENLSKHIMAQVRRLSIKK